MAHLFAECETLGNLFKMFLCVPRMRGATVNSATFRVLTVLLQNCAMFSNV